jgi:hypothetical protein
MSKYHFTIEPRLDLVQRMYQDHGYDVDEICLRLRYPIEIVKEIIKKNNLLHGTKSWRY